MDFLTSIPFKFLLPFILLGIQFSLKYFIDRRATAFNFFVALLEVPINMFFISLSLLAGFIIAGSGNIQKAFIFFLMILLILIFCIFFWRRSVELFQNENYVKSFLLGFLNFILSLPVIIYIITFLIDNTKL